MTLSVVVLQHGLPDLTRVALESIQASDVPVDELILVDNGSAPADLDWVYGWPGPLKVVRLPENVGYLRGTNAGWEVATGDYIALCNNDISLSKQCLRRLVATLEADRSIGWVSACYQDGPWRRCVTPFPADVAEVVNESQGRARGPMDKFADFLGDHPNVNIVGFTEATVVLVRRVLREQIGTYWGELVYHHSHDYALRLRDAGYKTAVCRNAIFWHSMEHKTMVAVQGAVTLAENLERSTQLMDERWGERWRSL